MKPGSSWVIATWLAASGLLQTAVGGFGCVDQIRPFFVRVNVYLRQPARVLVTTAFGWQYSRTIAPLLFSAQR